MSFSKPVEQMNMRETQQAILSNHEQYNGFFDCQDISDNERVFHIKTIDTHLVALLERRKFLRLELSRVDN